MLGAALTVHLARLGSLIGLSRGVVNPHGHPAVPTETIQHDIGDPGVVEKIVDHRPDFAVHAAAMTDVDGCEEKPQEAFRINAEGAGYVAQACRVLKIPLMAVSTDYVFDGKLSRPYRETDPVAPLSIYGQSKRAGEEAIMAAAPDWMIVRSGWIYGPGGRNFIDSILGRAQKGETLRVVNDQFGSPTYTEDLAQAMAQLLMAWKRSGFSDQTAGLYHVANGFGCSRWELAVKAVHLAGFAGAQVVPVASEEVTRPARRPRNSQLDTSRFAAWVGQPLRSWEAALSAYIESSWRKLTCVS